MTLQEGGQQMGGGSSHITHQVPSLLTSEFSLLLLTSPPCPAFPPRQKGFAHPHGLRSLGVTFFAPSNCWDPNTSLLQYQPQLPPVLQTQTSGHHTVCLKSLWGCMPGSAGVRARGQGASRLVPVTWGGGQAASLPPPTLPALSPFSKSLFP